MTLLEGQLETGSIDMINPEDSGATRETIRSLSRIDKENAINGLARTPSTNGWNCYQDLKRQLREGINQSNCTLAIQEKNHFLPLAHLYRGWIIFYDFKHNKQPAAYMKNVAKNGRRY